MKDIVPRAIASTLLGTLTVAVMVSCASGSSPNEQGSTSSAETVARVDLVEAGIRAVAQHSKELFIRTKLCEGAGEGTTGACPATLTAEEIDVLATRLSDLGGDVRFVSSYDAIPEGQAPIEIAGSDFVFVGPPQERGDGTYLIEAGETCGGLCGHGGTYVLELRDGRWVATGNAPGTGTWEA
jgi:hypothetical protein